MFSRKVKTLVHSTLLTICAIAILASCGEDKGTNSGETSSQFVIWYSRLFPSPKALMLDGETLDLVDSVQFGQYSYMDGFAVSGTNLAALVCPGWYGTEPATLVVDVVTRDTVAIRSGIGGNSVRISPDGKYLVLGYENIRVFSLPTLQEVISLSLPNGNFVFDPVQNRLLAQSSRSSDSITTWDLSMIPPQSTTKKVPSAEGRNIDFLYGLSYLPYGNNIAISYHGDSTKDMYEADIDSFNYVRDWYSSYDPIQTMHFIGDSKILCVKRVEPQWTTNGNFWFDLIDQKTLAVEKTITQSEIRQYITGNFSANARSIRSTPDGRWAYLVIDDGFQDGAFVYKIDLASFKIDRVTYIGDGYCNSIMIAKKP